MTEMRLVLVAEIGGGGGGGGGLQSRRSENLFIFRCIPIY